MTQRFVACLVVFATLLVARPADACVCTNPSLRSAFKRAEVVFWGEVTAADKRTGTIEVSVVGVWKGAVPATATIESGATTCNLTFAGARTGKKFLFAARFRDGVLHARQCEGSRLVTTRVLAAMDKIAGPQRAP